MKEVTAKAAGLTKEMQYKIIFTELLKGGLPMSDIYKLINDELAKNGKILSQQGEASLRNLINKVAVSEGYIFPYDDKENPNKWRLTPEGRDFISQNKTQVEEVFNTETQKPEKYESNSVRGALFEKYCLGLLKKIYPYYTWYHQGLQKNNERGLDLIGEKIGEIRTEHKSIGVQVKLHQPTFSPTQTEWLKFLAGCFVRQIDKGIFITTGRLTSEQRREAGEGKIMIIEGIEELNRLAKEYNYEPYEE